jgi:Zn-dependent M28 family amino/carboxypeptidase
MSCGGDAAFEAALETITADDLLPDVLTLSSDEFEGRAPSSPGELKTIEFLKGEFEELGLEPGNGDSYFQEVPLVRITADPGARMVVSGRGARSSFDYGDDLIAWTKRVTQRAAVEGSELVFVGYGIVAPEYGWDDYEDLDVTGKTVVVLVNDPGFATQDASLFNGNAMTYYGRWTYKYEEAARQGAAAAFVVHETDPAAYPWTVVQGTWSGPQFGLEAEDDMSRLSVEGWWTVAATRQVFEQAGFDYDSLKSLAERPGFKAVPLGLAASLAIENDVERSVSNNVIGVIPGTDRADEYVVYMAHWDHFGLDPNLEGDQIYNGANDNATGVSALIELAEAFLSLDDRPARSIMFIGVTAEEFGLLGSAYYAQNPTVPLDKTVAAINIDGLNILGPMNDISVIGYGNSELDGYLERAAATQDRMVRPDTEPEKGYYYRSDHFNFAKVGVPALFPDAGLDHVVHGEEWTEQKRAEYLAQHYHKVSDEYRSDWDLSGAIDDVRLYFEVGYQLASDSQFPNWHEGTEFKAVRDAMMVGR